MRLFPSGHIIGRLYTSTFLPDGSGRLQVVFFKIGFDRIICVLVLK